MHAAHIASPLIEPAAGMIDRSCGISFPNELFDPKRVKLSPPLIKRNPESNAGIVIKLMHHADDVPLEAPPRLLILSHEQFVMVVAQMSACCRKDRGQIGLKERLHGASAVYHILPDHHSDPVAVIVKAGRLYFDMLAEHVESELLHLLYVVHERLVRGRRHKALRPVSLIQNSVEKVRLAVQKQPGLSLFIISDTEGPHGKVALDHIFPRFDPQIVQLRVFGAPETGVLHRDPHLQTGGHGICVDIFIALHSDPDLSAHTFYRFFRITFPYIRLFGEPQRQFNCFLFRVRSDLQMLEIDFRNHFHPDGLPDAALRVVEHAARIEGLLASALVSFIRIIPDQHFQLIAAGYCEFCHIKAECKIPVSMASHPVTVPENSTALIHSPEMQDQPFPFRHLKVLDGPSVPEGLTRLQGTFDAGSHSFRRKGDQY